MNNQEAIRLMRNLPTMCEFTDAYGEPIDSDAYYEAIELAISALQTQDVPDTNVGDMISRQTAIDAIGKVSDELYENIKKGATFPQRQWFDGMAQAQSILENLPSAQQGLCEYCHEDSDGYVKPVEKNCHAFISFGMDGWELSLKASGWHGSAKIKYCPMCGRELKNDK